MQNARPSTGAEEVTIRAVTMLPASTSVDYVTPILAVDADDLGYDRERGRLTEAPARRRGQGSMKLTIEFDREEDGRWIASVLEIAGLHVYGDTKTAARKRAQSVALHVIADRIEHGEAEPLDAYLFEVAG